MALALLAAGCGGGGAGRRTLTVLAAASLTDAFTELAEVFEDAHPGVTVALAFAGSSSLREQLLAGAPGDVVALADERTMDELVAAGAASAPATFATNELQLVVPAGNPGAVAGLADLADEDLLVGLCAPAVPCGRLAREALAAAGVTAAADTEEPDVRALLTKVAAGELDAGLVYRTDVVAGGDAVEGIALPVQQRAATSYPIALVTDDGDAGDDAAAARAFVELVLSASGRRVLAAHGFGPP